GWNGGYDTNWEDLAYNNHAGLKEVQLSASGGDDKTKYFLSGSYLDQDGILFSNQFGRTSGRINLEHRSPKNYELGINMSLSKSNNDRLPTDGDFNAPSSLNAIPPVQPLRDPDDPEEYYDKTLYLNAYRFLDGGSLWYSKVFSNLGNVYLNWRPIKNLSFHHDFGLDHKTQDDKLWISSRGSLPILGEPGGYAYSSFRTSSSFTTNHYVTFQQQIKDAGYDVTLGTVFFNYYQHYNRVSGRKFPNDDFRNISNAAETFEGRELENEISSISYFLRANFNWKRKYLFSFTSRRDGDSRFGPDTRYGFFPAASVGWVISDESFLVENPVFSYLKFRASWGITGNVPPGAYPYQDNFAGGYYAGRPSIGPSRIANPALKWEQTAQYDLGLDFGLWNDRISGQLDVYRKNTRDLLLNVNIPATTGFGGQLQNLGKMTNQGIELSLSAHILSQGFKWTASLNAAKNKNEITDIQGQIIESGINRAIEGQPIGVFFAVEYAGVDPDNGDALYYLNNELDDGSRNRTTTNDINLAERVVIGDPNPDLTYGISNSFSFKGFHLDLFFQGQQGNQIYNAAGIYEMDGFGWFDNQDIRMLDRWQNPGDITKIPQLRFLEPGVNSSRYLEPGSYFRLKTLTLAYLLPDKLLTPLKLSKLQFYFTAQNLLTVTNYQGWDPEVNADFLEGTISKGIDYYSPPQAKTLVFGIKAGF
ncbi:MAG: SusC/RagA family TonB-linked outer membrane protein, partial [Saprospiraceae bacterium]